MDTPNEVPRFSASFFRRKLSRIPSLPRWPSLSRWSRRSLSFADPSFMEDARLDSPSVVRKMHKSKERPTRADRPTATQRATQSRTNLLLHLVPSPSRLQVGFIPAYIVRSPRRSRMPSTPARWVGSMCTAARRVVSSTITRAHLRLSSMTLYRSARVRTEVPPARPILHRSS